MDKVRELAKIFREMAESYDEFANISENEELDAQLKEEQLERLMGKIMVQSLKAQKLK